MMVRHCYNVWTEAGDNTGLYFDDFELACYFADKWAQDRALPHMVIDRECNLVHYVDPSDPQATVPKLA